MNYGTRIKIFAISKSDYEYLRLSYENIHYVSAFHNNEKNVTSKIREREFYFVPGETWA